MLLTQACASVHCQAHTLFLSCWMTSPTSRKKPGCVKLFQCFLFFNAVESYSYMHIITASVQQVLSMQFTPHATGCDAAGMTTGTSAHRHDTCEGTPAHLTYDMHVELLHGRHRMETKLKWCTFRPGMVTNV
jgi:hypothetical protein